MATTISFATKDNGGYRARRLQRREFNPIAHLCLMV
jgi:hypothetical protein